MQADLHVHVLPWSRDSRMGVDELASAVGTFGLEAIAITDHSPGTDYPAVRETLARVGVALIPGREMQGPLGHILVLSTDEEWLAALPDRCDLPLSGPGRGPHATVWAHPGWEFVGSIALPDPLPGVEHLHGVEVLNGERLFQAERVELGARLVAELGVSACGGSDAHDALSVGCCLTEVPGAADVEEFIEGIAAGLARPVVGAEWARTGGRAYKRRADLTPYWPEETASDRTSHGETCETTRTRTT